MNLKIQFKLALINFAYAFCCISKYRTSEIAIKYDQRTKRLKSHYNVSSKATLKVKNSFGNLNIVTWDENRIEFDITYKSNW